MSAHSATLAGRAAAESLMIDTCSVVRVTGEHTDPVTGVSTPTTTPVYAGKCRAKAPGALAVPSNESGGHVVVSTGGELHLPVGSFDAQPGDLATITAAVGDPTMSGLVYRLEAPFHGTLTTAYRFRITQEVA